MTNYERIKAMNLEEMAEFFMNDCQMCIYDLNMCRYKDCMEGTFEWLKQEVENG